jgi:hypothetical protein
MARSRRPQDGGGSPNPGSPGAEAGARPSRESQKRLPRPLTSKVRVPWLAAMVLPAQRYQIVEPAASPQPERLPVVRVQGVEP